MHMLPEGTTTMGFGLFRARVEPYQKPKKMSMIRPMIVAVWTYSFFQSLLNVAFNAFASVCPVGVAVLYVFCVLKVTAWKGKNEGG